MALPLCPSLLPAAVLDRGEYAALRRELAELKAEAADARSGSRAGQRARVSMGADSIATSKLCGDAF